MTIINCQYVKIYTQIKTLLRRKQANVAQYVLTDGNPARTIHAVNALLTIFYEKGYAGYVYMPDAAAECLGHKGVMDSDMLFCAYRDACGRPREETIIFDSETHGYVKTRVGDAPRTGLFPIPQSKYAPFKRVYFNYDAFENYIQYSLDYMALELNRAIYKIKPDIGIDFISA